MQQFHDDLMLFSILFLIIGGGLIFVFISQYKREQLRQMTLQKAIEKGYELTPELLEKLGLDIDQGQRDYRRGILVTLFGATALVVSLLIDLPGHTRQTYHYLSTFPLIIGLGYLFVWRTSSRRK
jgi:hypothetical protein